MAKNTEELELINSAKSGNPEAVDQLFRRYYSFMKSTHEHGPDGRFSGSSDAVVTDFETALADENIYEVFMKCIETFDANKSSFSTHLGYRMKMAARDRIRNAKREEKKMKLISYSDDETTNEHNDKVGDYSPSAFDWATAAWVEQHDAESLEHDDSFEFIDMMIEECGRDSIEARYIEQFCALGVDSKKHTGEICEALDCSRQTLGNIKKRLYERFVERYRMKFVA